MNTFTWSPSYGVNLTMRPNVKRISFGDGYEQRQTFGINSQPESWALEFRGRTHVDAQAIDAFLREAASRDWFEWTSPADTVGRFVCDEWSRSVDEPNVETVRATFRQVFDPA